MEVNFHYAFRDIAGIAGNINGEADMEIGHRNPFIMNQFAAQYGERGKSGGRQEKFGLVLESAEETAKGRRLPKAKEQECGEETDYRKLLQEKMEEMLANIRKGTIQPKIQIGAEAYTQEEWKKLLDKIDAAEETLREQVETEIAMAKKEAEEKADDKDDGETQIITRADGARILMIRTSFGEMSVELSGPDEQNFPTNAIDAAGHSEEQPTLLPHSQNPC